MHAGIPPKCKRIRSMYIYRHIQIAMPYSGALGLVIVVFRAVVPGLVRRDYPFVVVKDLRVVAEARRDCLYNMLHIAGRLQGPPAGCTRKRNSDCIAHAFHHADCGVPRTRRDAAERCALLLPRGLAPAAGGILCHSSCSCISSCRLRSSAHAARGIQLAPCCGCGCQYHLRYQAPPYFVQIAEFRAAARCIYYLLPTTLVPQRRWSFCCLNKHHI